MDPLISVSDHIRSRARMWSGAIIALGHLSLFLLAASNRLNITVPSEFRLLASAIQNNVWLLAHLVCAVFIITSILRDKWQYQALSFSAGWMGVWAFLSLLGALTSIKPVSLAGPVLGLILAGMAYSIAMSWAVAPRNKADPHED